MNIYISFQVYRRNSGYTGGIQGTQGEFRVYRGNSGYSGGIQGIHGEFEYTWGIQGIQGEFRLYMGNSLYTGKCHFIQENAVYGLQKQSKNGVYLYSVFGLSN